MGYYKYRTKSYTLDSTHGFGIMYQLANEQKKEFRVYYEDDTFSSCQKSEAEDNVDYSIRCFQEQESRGWIQYTAKEQAAIDKLLAEGSCQFQLTAKGSVRATLKSDKEEYEMIAGERTGRYSSWTKITCSCEKDHCVHQRAAAIFCRERLKKLQHSYIVTKQPVDKSLFVESSLADAMESGIVRDFTEASIEAVRELIRKLDSARSTAYYRRFHEYLLDLEPYYDYNSKFLEKFHYFLLALFEDAGYQKAVIQKGDFADQTQYEGRQRRSNRVCFKRTLKEYGKIIKELEKGDYSEHLFKEFLLLYRKDYASLLRYYAMEKEQLEEDGLEHLAQIAGMPDADPQYCKLAAGKMGSLADCEEAPEVFRALLSHVSHEDMIQVYSQVQSIPVSLEEVRTLPPDEQLALINNLPVSEETFGYVMDELIADKEPALRGRFILSTLNKLMHFRDAKFKKRIVEEAAKLPDNRLLLKYLCYRLNYDAKLKDSRSHAGSAREELRTYFDCDFHVVNEKSSYSVHFIVADPAEKQWDVIHLIERHDGNGKEKYGFSNLLRDLKYDAGTVKEVCLEGREEAYAKALEKQQDAVDEYLFEKNNQKFTAAYRKLCESFQDEKIIFRAAQKAQIEWLIYREDHSNALAFRVGNTKKYIVKDASAFISAFKEGQTITYGKDLILTHDPDNLTEQDAAMVKILMAARYSAGRKDDKKNKRYMTVSDSVLSSLFEHLAGGMVLYNDQPCLIRLDAQKVRLQISGSYVLSTSLGKEQEFLNLLGKGFVVARGEGDHPYVIDRAEGSAEEIGLIELVDANPGVKVKPILKDFKKNIYARFFELFDVDKTVARDFQLSEIRLHTYFDYEKSVITMKTKILKDDKQIRPDQLSQRMDLVKYEMLSDYLAELGFADGVMEDEGRILSFFKMDFTRLKKLTNVYLSEQLQNKEIKSVGKPVVRVTYNNNILEAFLEKSEYTEGDLEKILSAIRRKKKFILLTGNRIVDLDSEMARDFAETVRDLQLDPKDLYHKKTIDMVTAIKAFAHEKSCRADRYLRDMIEEIRGFKDAQIKVPRMQAKLRDYQVEGYHWLSILSKYGMGGILADDMGLGKTIQMIALIKADPTKQPSLVVCPKSLVFNWISEFGRFDGKTEVVEIYGSDSVRSEKIASIDYGKKAVYVTSYDSLRNDISKYTGEFNYGILDEAQYIKNVHALKTKSVKELKVRHRFALTGTPIENSVVDLWSIFDYVMPGYFEELSRFKESDHAAIARKAAPFILRRVKTDVLEDLPAKYERILSADMSSGQRKVYEAFRLDARKQLEGGGKAFDILPYLTRLRQICVDPAMFLDDYTDGSGKLDMLRTLIPEYLQEGHRILVFSQFVKALESVDQMLKELSIPAYFLSGATAAKDRIEMMDSFNNGSGTDVFLISLKAGGTGLNLTGADTVIHLDPWWNVAAENQATDRTHRIGQKRNVEEIKLITADSIEQRVIELQDMKKEVIRQVISDDDGSVTSASLEDIAFILG